jgi:hypothetical protein
MSDHGSRRQHSTTRTPGQVEVEKIDPEAFLKQGLQGTPEKPALRDPEAELMAHAIPMGPPVPKEPEKPKDEDEDAEVKPPPPPEPEDPLDRVLPGSVVDRLTKKFGILGDTEELIDDVLVAGGKEVKISFRKPHYDDFLWALGEVETRIRTGQDLSLLRGDQARQAFLNHLSACCTVVKIEDEYVWDVFNASNVILEMKPDWDRTSLEEVPFLIRSNIINNTYELLRMLHPDLLFALRGTVIDHFPDSGGIEDEEGKEEEEEDPLPAA